MPTLQEVFGPQMERLLTRLDRQASMSRRMSSYYEGGPPFPQAVIDAKLKNAYRSMMSMSSAPWAQLAVNSVQDRLEVAGIRTGDKAQDESLWRVWQDNAMDAESKLAHSAALVDGRAYATVWPAMERPRDPEIVLDSAENMVVEYMEGRHQPRYRLAALRSWVEGSGDNEVVYATLYRPDGIHRFRTFKDTRSETIEANGRKWEPYSRDDDENWPVPNPYNRVPVVELAVNRRLKPGPFPYARGEFESCTGVLDQINLLTFLGLVVAIYMGFPLTYASGVKIQRVLLKDDNGDPLLDDDGKQQFQQKSPIDRKPDSLSVIEDPQGKLGQLEAANRENLSIFPELASFASLTATPRHYFPIKSGFSNISADTIRADEGGLNAKVLGLHQPWLGEGWEEVLRLSGLMLDEPVIVPPNAEVKWQDHESRSMAERADAATKVASIGLPALTVAEKYLNFTQAELNRLRSDMTDNAIDRLFSAATSTPTENGNGTTPVTF